MNAAKEGFNRTQSIFFFANYKVGILLSSQENKLNVTVRMIDRLGRLVNTGLDTSYFLSQSKANLISLFAT